MENGNSECGFYGGCMVYEDDTDTMRAIQCLQGEIRNFDTFTWNIAIENATNIAFFASFTSSYGFPLALPLFTHKLVRSRPTLTMPYPPIAD